MPPRIALETVGFSGERGWIVKDVSFSLQADQHRVVYGASGSGISVLLHMCAGVQRPHRGRVRWNGRILDTTDSRTTIRLRCRMGCVLQKNALISNLTAYDNCALALRYFKITDERGIRARVMQVLQRLHVADAAHLLPERLSYGQARRVALARACVPAPDLLIIDELFAGVDEYSRDTLHTYITTYAQKYACTVIMGTKNRTVADTLPWTRFTIEQGRVVF